MPQPPQSAQFVSPDDDDVVVDPEDDVVPDELDVPLGALVLASEPHPNKRTASPHFAFITRVYRQSGASEASCAMTNC